MSAWLRMKFGPSSSIEDLWSAAIECEPLLAVRGRSGLAFYQDDDGISLNEEEGDEIVEIGRAGALSMHVLIVTPYNYLEGRANGIQSSYYILSNSRRQLLSTLDKRNFPTYETLSVAKRILLVQHRNLTASGQNGLTELILERLNRADYPDIHCMRAKLELRANARYRKRYSDGSNWI